MSKMLDDVKQLGQPGISVVCDFCTGSPISGHLNGCPILTVPRLVALVEAAERLRPNDSVIAEVWGGDYGEHSSYICGACEETSGYYNLFEHKPDCPWQALVAALGDA